MARWFGVPILAPIALLLTLAAPLAAAYAGCSPIAFGPSRIERAATVAPEVAITFLGHASFLIETPDNVRAVTDYSGVFTPPEPPDLVTMNHTHQTHFTMSPDPRIRYVLHGWQKGAEPPRHNVVLRDLRVTNLPTNTRDWRGGVEINGSSIFIFETAGLCIAHLGHLHHLLEPRDLDVMGRIDIVMVPVDGSFTLSQGDAMALLEQLQPRIVLPMHYFTQDRLARFLRLMQDKYDVQVQDSPTLTVSRATLPSRPTVIALPGPH